MNTVDPLANVQTGKQGTSSANLDHFYIRKSTLNIKKVRLTTDALRLIEVT